jgi:hypothetical protein
LISTEQLRADSEGKELSIEEILWLLTVPQKNISSMAEITMDLTRIFLSP